MRTIDEFLHVAVSTAKRFKRKFPRADYDELLSDAYLHLVQAFNDADKSKSKGELDVFIRSRIVWRITDEIRRRKHLWLDEHKRVKIYSINKFDSDSEGFGDDLDGVFFNGYKSDEQRRGFLDDVKDLIDVALIGKPELAFMYKLVFVDGLTDVEIKKARRVSLKLIRAKRQELMDVVKPYLDLVRTGKRSWKK